MRPVPSWTLVLAVLADLGRAAPAQNRTVDRRQWACEDPPVRREWRTLSDGEKREYISAVQCVLMLPPLSGLPGAMSRYDDFVGTHIVQAPEVHFTGIFYPYHRLLVASFEVALRAECGYGGGQPYWDWLYDVDDMFASPVFDPVTGFGSNGEFVPGTMEDPYPGVPVTAPETFPDRTGGGCIADGPFAGLWTNMGPEDNVGVNPHCVRRDFCPVTFANLVTTLWGALRTPNFWYFARASEPACHAGGHYGVGGLYGAMTDRWASPVDPVFWLHHANLDRVWWSWQVRDLRYRLSDISGPLVGGDWNNEQDGDLTLSHPCVLVATGDAMAVGDTLDIAGGPLCYTYDAIY